MELKLSDDGKRLLAAMQLNAGETLLSAAVRAGIEPQRAHYLFRKFRENALIKKRTFLDINRLGVYQYSIYARFSFATNSARDLFLVTIMNEPLVVDVYEMLGRFNYGINIYARNPGIVSRLLEEILQRIEVSVAHSSMIVRIQHTLMRRRLFGEVKNSSAFLQTTLEEDSVNIDVIDHRILSAINSHPWSSLRELAKILEIAHTTLDFRIRKLKTSGVLLGEVYGIYTEKLGITTYRLLLKLRKRGLVVKEKIRQFVKEAIGVYVIIFVLGEWDYEFIIEANAQREINQYVDVLQMGLVDAIEWVEVVQLSSYLKVSDFPALALERASRA
jgi:DNA-binding Lrp family transcriptional regulator